VFVVDMSASVLSWLGRQGTRAVAALVVIGIALPSVGSMLKPYVTPAIFSLLCIAFLRMDVTACRACVRRPAIALAATAWSSFGIPILVGSAGLLSGLSRRAPDLFLALMLQAIASPMMAAPALAALMGLDGTLVLVTLITSTAMLPLSAPVLALVFLGPNVPISPLALAAKLLAILAGAALVGFVVRRVVGLAVIKEQKERIDGLNVLILFVFVAAVMEGVGAHFLASPMKTAALTALAFLIFFAVLLLTALVFLCAGRERAVALGFMASQRNLGLMLAGTGGALPDLAWLYFALSQFPIYLSPGLLQPVTRRILKRG
jgi:hypothetical protein